MLRLAPEKIAVWYLVIACFCSFGGGFGRAVICFDRHGGVELAFLHSGDHCVLEHLYGQHQHHDSNHREFVPGHYSEWDNVYSVTSGDCCCSVCNDIEVSLQFFAPRRKLIKNFISSNLKPIHESLICSVPPVSAEIINAASVRSSVLNSTLALLESVIILI